MSDIIRKTEKLASAVYLITSFFNDQEPLKWKLRTLASEFTSLAISFNDEFFKEREAVILETKNLIAKTVSLLKVALNVGLVSSLNYELMQTEFAKYVDVFGQPANISDVLNIESPKKNIVEEVDKNLLVVDKSGRELPERISTVKPYNEEKPLKNFGVVLVKKTNRQSIIIGILKRKKEIMIKDVSSLINGCSEKTIQRELSAMVHSGVLKKVGEKRWSHYSLA